jgi:hypothetical protein
MISKISPAILLTDITPLSQTITITDIGSISDDIAIYNFKKLFTKKDTIIWKDCTNIKIIINSKINKIIFENCKNIELCMYDAVIGVELNNCHDLKINIKKHINSFEAYKSTVMLNQKTNEKTFFFCDKTKFIQRAC